MKVFYLLLLCCLSVNMFAQVMDNSYKLYDDSELAVIKVLMDDSDYEYMIANPRTDSAHHCTLYFKNAFINDTVSNAGIRIRGNTSRDSEKKSFKISFDEFEPGKEFYGSDKLNLNGEHNDPSMARAKICWDLFQQIGTIGSRAAHALLYINNEFHGIYSSIEQVDNEFLKRKYRDPSGNLFKCLYPGELTYKGPNETDYYYTRAFPAYELITNEKEKNYSELLRFINIINFTPASTFADSLESILVVQEYLKYQAMNVLMGSWDDYWSVMNNYYLYFDPEIKKFHWIPYDYDNSFGIDWSGNDWTNANPYAFPKVVPGSRPLVENILKVPEYRNLYTHFLEFYSNNVVNAEKLSSKLSKLKNMLAQYADDDVYRTLDYGFTYSDFINSFDVLSKKHVKKGIKEFLTQRPVNLKSQLTYRSANPVVYNSHYEYKNDSIYIYASAFDNEGLAGLKIKYSPSDQTEQDLSMEYLPLQSSKVEDADRWLGVIPAPKDGEVIKFRIEATDNSQHASTYPRNEFIEVKSNPLASGVVINEILADNSGLIPDPVGENDDFVELFNPTNEPILLTGMYLTDKSNTPSKWKFTQPDLFINPGEYLVIWCDENHNDNQPGLHANFKLSKGGEFIGLADTDSTTWIDSLSFGEQATDISYSRMPDGYSSWVFNSPTPGTANVITSVTEDKLLPETFTLSVYPNPFNPYTNIKFSIPQSSDVVISIFDILGNEVWSDRMYNQVSGSHLLRWDARSNAGTVLSSGVYFCRVSAGKHVSIKKLMFLK